MKRVTRRHFVELMGKSAAAAAIAGSSDTAVVADVQEIEDAVKVSKGPRKKIVVIGAGVFGGWTALSLQRSGADVTLVDAWRPGHSRASSGGESRVIRAIYGPDRRYVEMVRDSFANWEGLEQQSGTSLLTSTGALWLLHESQSYVDASLPVLEEFGFPVDDIPLEAAKARFPMFDFSGVRRVVLERRAGVLSARFGCEVLARQLTKEGGTYRQARAAPIRGDGPHMESLVTSNETLRADAFVFCCGPWLGQLVPDIHDDLIRPTRQEVYYFGVPAGIDAFSAENCPVWIDFGDRIYYGLPDVHGRGFKIADDTRGAAIDPSTLDRTPSRDGIASARAFLARRFPALRDAPLVESRVCQYENSEDGDLFVDRHPRLENVFVVGGGSGHGYKLGPAVGQIAARMTLGLSPPPAKFSLSRLNESDGRKGTQFEASD